MEKTRVRLGIIGLGAMGGRMLAVASEHPDFEVVLAADPDGQAVERTAARYPDLSITRDPGELVSGLDALYIASPPATHAGYAIAALAAGTAVLCEKPLAIDLDEGERMVLAAEQAGLANAVNFALSDGAAAVAVGRAVHDGEIGDVVGVDMRLAFPQWPRAFQQDARWLAGRAQGGFLREVASHFVFLTDRVLGPLTPVSTRVSYGDAAESAAVGVFTAGDAPVTLNGVLGAAPETYEWTLYGTKVSYRITSWNDLWRSEGDGWVRVEPDVPRGGEHARLGEFARALRGEQTTLADFAAGLRVQRVIEHFHATA